VATVMVSVVLFIVGLAVGSFLNVCIWRLPRGESIISPLSHCPHCGQPIPVRDNIPLLSYLILRGNCRYCGEKISLQYPLVELVTAVLFVLVFLKHGLSWGLVSSLFFISVLLLVAVIDLKHQIIPNKVILPALAVQFILILAPFIYLTELREVLPHLAGFFIGGGTLLIAALVSPLVFGKEGMGGGDIKLGAFIGLTLSWYVLVALFVGFLTGALVGLTLIALKRKTRKDLIPFGPFLSLGGLVALFLGPQIFLFYLGLLP